MLRTTFLLLAALVLMCTMFTPLYTDDVEIRDIVCYHVPVLDPSDPIFFSLPPSVGFVLKQVFVGTHGEQIILYESDVPKTSITPFPVAVEFDIGIPFEQGCTMELIALNRTENVTFIGYIYRQDVELNNACSYYVTIPDPPGTIDIELAEGEGFILREAFSGSRGETIDIAENGDLKTSMWVAIEAQTKWHSDLGIPFKKGCIITLSAATEETEVTLVGYKY